MSKKLRINIVMEGAPAAWAMTAIEYWQSKIDTFADIHLIPIRQKSRRKIIDAFVGFSEKSAIELTRNGEMLSSSRWADLLAKAAIHPGEITFLIGGADGLDEKVLSICKQKISLSPSTLQHDVALIVVLEQIFRAMTILSGHPYHRGKKS